MMNRSSMRITGGMVVETHMLKEAPPMSLILIFYRRCQRIPMHPFACVVEFRFPLRSQRQVRGNVTDSNRCDNDSLIRPGVCCGAIGVTERIACSADFSRCWNASRARSLGH